MLIETAHRNLRIDSRSRVSVSRQAPGRAAPSPSWESVRDVAFEATSLGPTSPVGYVFASSLVPVLAPVTAYAAASFPPGAGILAGAVDLMHRIRSDFKYDPKATVISTPLKEVFEKRHGVCQDFAHVMIAGLRGLGLPAAYVSGYLRTIPPPGKPRLQGADATHAWVSVWCGDEIGWVGFDPTNDLLVENDHIILAVGPRLLRRLAGRRHHRRLAQAEARRGGGRAAGGVDRTIAFSSEACPDLIRGGYRFA